MTTDDDRQGEEPELLTIAEVLTESARGELRQAYQRWAVMTADTAEALGGPEAATLEAFTAGWRAALEWYIASVTLPAVEAARNLRLAEQARRTAGETRPGFVVFACSSCGSRDEYPLPAVAPEAYNPLCTNCGRPVGG